MAKGTWAHPGEQCKGLCGSVLVPERADDGFPWLYLSWLQLRKEEEMFHLSRTAGIQELPLCDKGTQGQAGALGSQEGK